MLTLEDAKNYLRVDGDEENKFIQSLINAADEHLLSVVSADVVEANPFRADMIRRLLIADWYEHRDITEDRPVTAQVRLLITKLQAQGWK